MKYERENSKVRVARCTFTHDQLTNEIQMEVHDIPYEEMKPIYVSPQSKLNEDIAKNFDDMFSIATPTQYRDMLIEIYNMYILHEHNHLPPDFMHIAARMIVLMDFLKSCE